MSNQKKHFIILGAGASHDFIHEEDIPNEMRATWIRLGRPPLASHLFDARRFGSFLGEYPGVADLAARVLSALREGKDLEEFMQELYKKGGHRVSQLIEMVFYLAKLFQEISDKYGNSGTNNYRDLIGRIKDYGGRACIVTFNYDYLLESSLGNQLQKNKHELSDYISHDIQIIKLHGSCEWSYVSGPYHKYEQEEISNQGGIAKFLATNPNKVYGIEVSEKEVPQLIPERNFHKSILDQWNEPLEYFSYPALAIPMRIKHKHVCPDDHIRAMKESLKQASKILIIGWKAADENLLEVFREVIKNPIEFTIVSGKESKSAEDIKKRILEKVPDARFKVVDEGFTGFMSNRACEAFFEEDF